MPSFNEKLAQLLYSAEMTQLQLAESIGTKQQNISRWLSGSVYPRENILRKIAEVFGISLRELKDDSLALPPKEFSEYLKSLKNASLAAQHAFPKDKDASQTYFETLLTAGSVEFLKTRILELEERISKLEKHTDSVNDALVINSAKRLAAYKKSKQARNKLSG